MKWKRYLIFIGLAFFTYFIIKLDIRRIIEEISNINLYYLWIILPLILATFFTQTIKWFYLARKQRIEIGFLEAFKINLINNFYGNVTPSKVGSIIRVEYLKKYAGGIGKGLSNFVIDKAFDLSSLFFIAIIFSFIFKDTLGDYFIIYLIIILFGLLGATAIFINRERAKFFLRFFYNKFLSVKLKVKAKTTFEDFYKNMPSKFELFVTFLLNLINWTVIYLSVYVTGLSIGINLPFIYFLAILPLATVIGQLPISIDGLGTREAALISLFGIFNISATKVFSMSLIGIFFTIIVPAMIILPILLKEKE